MKVVINVRARYSFSMKKYLLCFLIVLWGCASPSPSSIHEKGSAASPMPVTKVEKSSPRDSLPYKGFGAESVSSDALKKYAPMPIDPRVRSEIESTMDLRGPGGGVFSPDGQTLYFQWGVTGTSQVWRLARGASFPVQLTAGEDPTSVFDVTPDGKSLIVLRERGGDEFFGIYLLPLAGGPLEPLIVKNKIKLDPEFLTQDGKYLYYTSNEKDPAGFSIYRLEMKSRRVEPVLEMPGLWMVGDHRPDGTLLIALQKGHSSREYYLLPAGSKNPQPLFGQGENELYSALFGAHPGEILVRTNKFGEFHRLYSFSSGKFRPLTPEAKWDVAGFTIDEKRRHVVYITNENGLYRLAALNAVTEKAVKLPKLPEALQQHVGAFSRDGNKVILFTETAQSPPQVYVYDWLKGSLERRTLPSLPEVDAQSFVRPTFRTFKGRDGTDIPEIVWRSEECQKHLCPVIVHLHGGPAAQTTAGFNPTAQLLVKHGFVFVEPNVRGSTGYGKSYEKADDGAKRLNVISDIAACAEDAKSTFAFQGRTPKVGVFGGSYGGYSTLAALTLFPGAYDAGFAIVGMSNLVSFLKNTAAYRAQLRVSEYGDPQKDVEALRKLSHIEFVEKVRVPLMIAHGLNDPRVPVGEALQFHEQLIRRGQSSKLVIFPDEGHGVQKRPNRVLLWGYLLEFFSANLR